MEKKRFENPRIILASNLISRVEKGEVVSITFVLIENSADGIISPKHEACALN